MASLNRIVLVGKVSADPEVRSTVEGKQVAKFQLLVERYTTDSAPQIDTIDIVAWEKLADICRQLVKSGKLVLVEGRIQIRTFDNEGGTRKWVTEVVARTLKVFDAGSKGAAVAAAASSQSDDIPGLPEIPEEEETDLPF
jgi:single-strand DNA-binding protein